MHNPLSHHLLTCAYNNGWANHRLLKVCALLNQQEFDAARSGFFPSIKATLNHILTTDWFYIDALERELRGSMPHPRYQVFFEPEQPFATCAALQAAQKDSDQRLIAYCRQIKDDELGRRVSILRTDSIQRDTRTRLLAHLFEHQTHHRGQVHAMLAGTRVEAPQLDAFFSEGEADERAPDFAELGWTEAEIWS
ncbi:DinB family protein [Janthinobacterium agaricidamnosum]|uniref:DinB family protein n=1 Tax=Janthinobacterium agaricidamnosum NBRC 102515 = DSM 9628 TaxID=1349767 RepID=W0V493_9BURK|nr:DinB family protein [Janthinobacterium agaricidamnosum]CDG82415.1 dinB family protein [Janthinobacterium agaricidamnosum NBRC 102515 = DSM 9628]